MAPVLMQSADTVEGARPWRVLAEGKPVVTFETLEDAFRHQVVLLNGQDLMSRLQWHHPKTGWQNYPY